MASLLVRMILTLARFCRVQITPRALTALLLIDQYPAIFYYPLIMFMPVSVLCRHVAEKLHSNRYELRAHRIREGARSSLWTPLSKSLREKEFLSEKSETMFWGAYREVTPTGAGRSVFWEEDLKDLSNGKIRSSPSETQPREGRGWMSNMSRWNWTDFENFIRWRI